MDNIAGHRNIQHIEGGEEEGDVQNKDKEREKWVVTHVLEKKEYKRIYMYKQPSERIYIKEPLSI